MIYTTHEYNKVSFIHVGNFINQRSVVSSSSETVQDTGKKVCWQCCCSLVRTSEKRELNNDSIVVVKPGLQNLKRLRLEEKRLNAIMSAA